MTRKPTPSEPPPTTLQILWGHPLAAPFFSKSSPLGSVELVGSQTLPRANTCNRQSITNQYPSTRFMLVDLSVDAQVHGRNHCTWLTSALCAQDLFVIWGRSLDICYNQCLQPDQPGPAKQMEDPWPELGHPSMHKRVKANQRRSQAPQLVYHSSLATLPKQSKPNHWIIKNASILRLHSVTPIPIGSKVLQICGTFCQGTNRSDKTKFVNRDAVNCSDMNWFDPYHIPLLSLEWAWFGTHGWMFHVFQTSRLPKIETPPLFASRFSSN